MTKKHYIAIAKLIDRLEVYDGALIHKHATVVGLCEIFAKDNPAFDAERFKTACGAKGAI